MKQSMQLTLSILALTLGVAQTTHAQSDAPVFAVAYIEVLPTSVGPAITLLKQLADTSQAESGNLRFQILQRIGRPNHFAILDAWTTVQLQDSHAEAAHTKSFRKELEPLLYSPYDERRSAPIMGTSAVGGDGEIIVLTHVDLVPRGLDEGLALVETLVAASRQEEGAVDVGVIVQNSRRNHMTLIEIWSNSANHEAHVSAEHVKRIRYELLSRSGSPYDERLYHLL
jgi:quinol monooxygenase YgiN